MSTLQGLTRTVGRTFLPWFSSPFRPRIPTCWVPKRISTGAYGCISTIQPLPAREALRNAIKKWADFFESRAKSQTDFLAKMEECYVSPLHKLILTCNIKSQQDRRSSFRWTRLLPICGGLGQKMTEDILDNQPKSI